MRIGRPENANANAPVSERGVGQKAPRGSAGGADARVSVSEEARALAQRSAGDTAKVERLRSMVRDGTFRVDASRIAARLVGGGE